MPNIPCPDKIDCPCDESPFANLSSEAPDLPVFIGRYVDRTPVPLGTEWLRAVCQGVCLSTVSQEAADLCAAAAATACVIGGWRSGDPSGAGGPPVPPAAGARGEVPNVALTNTPQSCSVPCADGLAFTFTVPAGVFAARTQAQADAQAHSYACRQAQLRRVCLSALSTPVCQGGPFSQRITASGKYINVPGKTDLWELTLGTLPDGLDFHGGNLAGGSVLIDGTPTTPGSYTFFVRVTDSKGDVMEKGYILTVAGITNAESLPQAAVGKAYDGQLETVGFEGALFALDSGDLPDGLTLNSDGSFTGTPTTGPEDSTFTVQVFDAVTLFNCIQSVTLHVKAAVCELPVFRTNEVLQNIGGMSFETGGPLLLTAGGGQFRTFNLTGFGLVPVSSVAEAGQNCMVVAATVGGVKKWAAFSWFDAQVYRLTLDPLAIEGSVPLAVIGHKQINIEQNSSTEIVYVGTEADMQAVDLSDLGVVATTVLPGDRKYFGAMAINTATNRVYVVVVLNDISDAYVSVLDGTTLAEITQFHLPEPFDFTVAWGLAYSPDSGHIYVAGNDSSGLPGGDDTIYILEATSGAVLQTIRPNSNLWVTPPGAATYQKNVIYDPAAKAVYLCAARQAFPQGSGVHVVCTAADTYLGFLDLTGQNLLLLGLCLDTMNRQLITSGGAFCDFP